VPLEDCKSWIRSCTTRDELEVAQELLFQTAVEHVGFASAVQVQHSKPTNEPRQSVARTRMNIGSRADE
jgi:hypothetical protein